MDSLDSGQGGEYPSDDITWIIPYGAGGGYDAYSRAIAQYMPKHLPSEVDIPVENHPGGGSRTGTTTLYRADSDGYTIGMIDTMGSAAYQSAIDPDFNDFDITKFSYFGTAASDLYGFWTAWDSEYETVEDLQNADQVRMTGAGLGDAASNSGLIACAEMEINNKNVFGYDGTLESVTAVSRGDGDITPVNLSSARSMYEDEEIRPIVAFGDNPIEWAPEAQVAVELGFDDLVSVARLDRALGTPPDTDDKIVETLEQAWLDTAKSDELKQWSEKNDRPIQPEDAETTRQNTQNAVETFKEFKDVFADVEQN